MVSGSFFTNLVSGGSSLITLWSVLNISGQLSLSTSNALCKESNAVPHLAAGHAFCNFVKGLIGNPFHLTINKIRNNIWQLSLTPFQELISIPVIKLIQPCGEIIKPMVFKLSHCQQVKGMFARLGKPVSGSLRKTSMELASSTFPIQWPLNVS
jgi:hypothetical protein